MANMKIDADGYSIEILTWGRRLDLNCDQVDIVVTLENGNRYSATLFTIAEVQKVMEAHRQSGECAGGKYFWCADMLIVCSLKAHTIQVAVEELMQQEEFESIFSKLRDESDA